MKQLFSRSFFKLVAGFWGILIVGIISLFVVGAYYGQNGNSGVSPVSPDHSYRAGR